MISPGPHTITNVSDPREWSSSYGPMKTYTIKVAGDEGAYDLNKKATSVAPAVGQTIDVASIDPGNGNFPPKIKLAQKAQGGGGQMDPAREARIVRQHSQSMALQYAQIRLGQGELPLDFSLADLFKIADKFDADAKAAKP